MKKFRRSTRCLITAAIALSTPLLAWAQQTEAPVTSTVHELGREDRSITATVVSIDQATRMVTLKGPKGKEVTVQAGPEVQNLDKVQPGDQVTAHYQSAVAVQVMPADSAQTGVDYQAAQAAAPKGSEPGLKSGQAVTVTSKLSAVDLKNHTVTLTGPDGKERTIEVKNPERQAQLSKLKVGDMVVATYVEALAVTVTPKAKSK
jgi:Cu/Ag efflux protein CusF